MGQKRHPLQQTATPRLPQSPVYDRDRSALQYAARGENRAHALQQDSVTRLPRQLLKKSSGMVRPSAFAVLRLRLTTSSNLYYSAAVLAGLPAAAFQDAVDIRRRLPVRSGSRKMQRFIRAKLEGPSLIISWANRDRTNQPFLPSNVGFAPKAIRRVPHWRGGLRVAHYTARRIRSRLHPRAALPSSRIR